MARVLKEVRGISLIEKSESEFYVDNGWNISEYFDESIKNELLSIEDEAQFVAVCQDLS